MPFVNEEEGREYRKRYYLEHREKIRSRSKKSYEENKELHHERSKEWAKINPEKRKAIVRKNYMQHREDKKAYSKKWALKNPDKTKAIKKAERIRNKDRYIKYRREYCKKRYREDLLYKLKNNITSGINSSLKNRVKRGRNWELLCGYTLKDLKNHLEKKFLNGMSWSNYGEWHIDHNIPISAFHFNSPEDYDFKRCWALSNLQPLWAEDNLRKHGRIPSGFQPSLPITAVENVR